MSITDWGDPFKFAAEIPKGSVKMSLYDVIRLSELKNVVSGHHPDIRLHQGPHDVIVHVAGKLSYCVKTPVMPDDDGYLPKDVARTILEKLAWNVHYWGAREVLIRHRRDKILKTQEPDVSLNF